MLSQELIELINARRFIEAAHAIRSQKPRLKSVSFSHPVFHLLSAYQNSRPNSYSMSYHGLSDEERSVMRLDMVGVLAAMIEGGMDMEMAASTSRSPSNQEEERSRIGLGHTLDKHNSFEVNDATLLVRLCGLGWTAALDVLQDKGYQPKAVEVDKAVLNSVRTEQENSISWLLSRHRVGVQKQWHRSSQLLGRLVKWDGVSPQTVFTLVEAFSISRAYDWVVVAHDQKGCDKTAVEWLSLNPGQWGSFHREIIQDEHTDRKPLPGLWTALFRQFVQQGAHADLVEEALSDPSFDHWKTKKFCNGVNLASWLAQGGALDPPKPRVADYMGVLPPECPAHKKLPAQLRRTVSLIRKLDHLGCQLRLGSSHEQTEGMAWSAREFSPTRAFIHRHEPFLSPSKNGASPVHSASTVEAALAWEALGAHSKENDALENPWVLGMEKADQPAPWAREIAARIKAASFDLNSQGENNKSLWAIATRSPPLARLILKKAKSPPSLIMMAAAATHHQFGLLKEWVDAGHLDTIAELRKPVLLALINPPSGMTDAASSAWVALLDSVKARPEKPWPEQIQAWRKVVLENQSRNRGYGYQLEHLHKKTLDMLKDWGPDAQQFWEANHRKDLPLMVREFPNWAEALPVELTQEDGVKLFWEVMLFNDDYATQTKRVSAAQKVWSYFNEALPISLYGSENFSTMKDLDESQPSGGFMSPSLGFSQFLEAEELMAGTGQQNLSVKPPGRRL